jgi:hypothetical protein
LPRSGNVVDVCRVMPVLFMATPAEDRLNYLFGGFRTTL